MGISSKDMFNHKGLRLGQMLQLIQRQIPKTRMAWPQELILMQIRPQHYKSRVLHDITIKAQERRHLITTWADQGHMHKIEQQVRTCTKAIEQTMFVPAIRQNQECQELHLEIVEVPKTIEMLALYAFAALMSLALPGCTELTCYLPAATQSRCTLFVRQLHDN